MGNIICGSKPDRIDGLVVTVGLKGSGKSSSLNTILRTPNLFTVRHTVSVTEDSYNAVRVKIKNRGCRDWRFNVFEFPGFVITDEEVSVDDQIVATIVGLINSAAMTTPIFLLLTIRFDDHRIEGEASSFVKMLRCLRRITYDILSKTKVILVLTHSSNEPDLRHVDIFESMASEYLRIESSQLSSVNFENSTRDESILNGSQHQVMEIFRKHMQITSANYGSMTSRHHCLVEQGPLPESLPLRPQNDPLVHQSSREGIVERFSGENSPILSVFKNNWSKVPQELKNDNVDLENCIRFLDRYMIYTNERLPVGEERTIEFLRKLKPTTAAVYILQDILKLNLPRLDSRAVLTGSAYNVFTDECVSNSIFSMAYSTYNVTSWGYQLPDYVQCIPNRENHPKDIYIVKKNWKELSEARLGSLGLSPRHKLKTPFSREGFNVYGPNGYITAIREYRFHTLKLNESISLSNVFLLAVGDLPEFNVSDKATIEKYKTFFDRYGTHVICTNFVGSRMLMETKLEPGCCNISSDYSSLTMDDVKRILDKCDKKYKQNAFRCGSYSVRVNRAGETIRHKLSREHVKFNNPVMLTSNMGLRPVYELIVNELSPKAVHLQKAFEHLIKLNN